jgi:hypothetical protein
MHLHEHIRDRTLIGYLWQFLNRCVEWGGLYQGIQRGIPCGASLSPLLGAFYLLELDRRLESLEVKHFRYMDDILILAAQTLANCASKALRLYEQEPPHPKVRRLGEYLRRWRCWAVWLLLVT